MQEVPPNTTFMDQFIDGGFAPVEYAGKLVYPDYWADVDEGDRIRLDWLDSRSPREQGVMLRLRLPERTGRKGEGGILQSEELEGPAIRLWERSAGPVTEVNCKKVRPGAKLLVTNTWEGPTGVEEGFNNFGMLIEELNPDAVILRCSDGVGSRPDFQDLVLRLSVLRGRAGEADPAAR